MSQILINALRETLIMLAPSCLLSVLIGIPLGILAANKDLYKVSNMIIKFIAQMPYLLIMLLCIPLSDWMIEHNIKFNVTMIIPLTITGSLLLANQVSNIIYALNQKWQSTAKAMGATQTQSLWLIILPEGLDRIVQASFESCAVLVGCSAIAGAFGAGGLGQLAIETVINKPQPLYALLAMAILLAIQQLIAYTGKLVVTQAKQ